MMQSVFDERTDYGKLDRCLPSGIISKIIEGQDYNILARRRS